MEGHINESVEKHTCANWPSSVPSAPQTAGNINVRDQIFKGLLDAYTIKQLLKKSDLTHDKTINMCRDQETPKNNEQK